MNVSAPFIDRPVATALLAIALLLAGILGFLRLPVAALPQVEFPTIEVTTQLPGASPDTITALVTAPLERQFGQIPALTAMTSQSSFGLSRITLQFELDRDIDAAAQDVQSAINAAASTLPRNLPYPPTYAKVNPADAAILTLALSSDTMSLRGMSDLADTLIAPRLSEVSGVGHVSIEGGIRPAVRIQADLARLASYKIGLEDLRAAIVAANVAGSKGSLDGAQQSYTIAANDQLNAAEAYRNVVVANRGSTSVRLRDVAIVTDGLENARVGGWYQGKSAVILDVRRQPGANVIQTVDLVRSELPRLRRSIPAGVDLEVIHDRTNTIRASIREVEFTLVLSAVLVVVVVLIFLRTLRATIIAGVALPLSIIATFAVMWLAGFSLDNLSLMALTIGTGFIVDDAIVMIENIVRNIEAGETPMRAALRGAREIGFTVISLTASLIAVFIPLLFMGGIVGRMFREFALTLSIAVLISAAISLSLTPMMCSRLLRGRRQRPNPFLRLVEMPMTFMARAYESTLAIALNRQALMLLVTAATLGLTAWLYIVIPKDFLPDQDTGLLNVVVEYAPDISFAELTRLQAQIARSIQADPDVAGIVSVAGIGTLNPTSNVGHFSIILVPRDRRALSAGAIAERLQAKAGDQAVAKLYIQPVQDIQIATRSSRSQYQYTLTGTEAAEISTWSRRLADELRGDPNFRNVAAETPQGGLRAFVTIDRERAARFGVSVQAVDDTLNDAFGQRQISTIYAQSNQYRVILEAAAEYQTDPSSLSRLYVQGSGGIPVRLDAFTAMTRTSAPLAIAHQEQFPAETLSFDLAPGASLGAAIDAIARAEQAIGMPRAIIGNFSADAAEFRRALAGEPWLILAAVVTIYIVLGMLYESFIHPLTILSTLPSAGVGALLALQLLGHTLSIVAVIGIILLMGIVKKNAIMMIDFALEAERRDGLTPQEAITRACRLRFRPIMMTTLAALLGALPLALAQGTGNELRVPMGITIVGGLLLSQLLTLYTTPVVYLTLERLRRRALTSGPPSEQDPPRPAIDAALGKTNEAGQQAA